MRVRRSAGRAPLGVRMAISLLRGARALTITAVASGTFEQGAAPFGIAAAILKKRMGILSGLTRFNTATRSSALHCAPVASVRKKHLCDFPAVHLAAISMFAAIGEP